MFISCTTQQKQQQQQQEQQLAMTWQFFLIATNLPHLPHLETAQERKKMTSFYWKLLRLLLLLQLMMLLLQLMLLLLLLLLVPSALAAFGHSDSGRWHSALINIKSKQVHIGLYRSASVYVCIYSIYVSVLQYLVFHFCTFISLFSSLLLCATCIFHWVHPWIGSDSGTNGRSRWPALRIVKPLYEKEGGKEWGGRYRESPFWLEGFELNLHFQLPFQFHRPRSVPLPPFPLRLHCVGVSIYCEILKLYKEYLNKTRRQRRSR